MPLKHFFVFTGVSVCDIIWIMKLHAITLFLTSIWNKQFLLTNAKSRNAVMPMLHKCFRIVAPVMGQNKPQWSDLSGPYNSISKAPVDMKINKSAKMNIKCTVLLLIPKDTN